jgi:hypothetical protein
MHGGDTGRQPPFVNTRIVRGREAERDSFYRSCEADETMGAFRESTGMRENLSRG